MNSNNYKKTTYNSPFICQRADPYIYRHSNGVYYFTASVPTYDKIVLRQATTLKGLNGAAEIEVWRKHDAGIMSQHIWAPELHYIDGEWYIYFAASSVDDIWALRPYVLRCCGNDPMKDRWEELGQIKASDPFSFTDFSLDMTVFSLRGKTYVVWAEKVSVGKKISNLYIAEMDSPNKLHSSQVLLSTPSFAWEREGFWVNEGPAYIHHAGCSYLTYSASETGSCYCMGLLTLEDGKDPLNPWNWEKSSGPVLKTDSDKGIYGPGHNSFTVNEEGEDVLVYHARQYDEIKGDPLYDYNRHTYLMKIKWDKSGPVFAFANNYLG